MPREDDAKSPPPLRTSSKARKSSARPETTQRKNSTQDEPKTAPAAQAAERETVKPKGSRELGQGGEDTETKPEQNASLEATESSPETTTGPEEAHTAPQPQAISLSASALQSASALADASALESAAALAGASALPAAPSASVAPSASALPVTPSIEAPAGPAATANPLAAAAAGAPEARGTAVTAVRDLPVDSELAAAKGNMPLSSSTMTSGEVAFALRLTSLNAAAGAPDESGAATSAEPNLSPTADPGSQSAHGGEATLNSGLQNPKGIQPDASAEAVKQTVSLRERRSEPPSAAPGKATEITASASVSQAAAEVSNSTVAESQAPAGQVSAAPEAAVRVSSSASRFEGPVRTGAEALRNTEIPATRTPSAPAAPARELSFRLERNQGVDSPVTVRFAERGGEIHVAVRSADEAVAKSLRSDLDGLAKRLEGHGLQTDRWTPPQALASNLGQAGEGQPKDGDLSRQRDPNGRQGQGQNGQGEPDRDRSGSGDQRQSRPRWLEELEKSRR